MLLPTGTITFLFTDIAGSTTLWEQRPQAMQVALARHDAILRAAIESHAGTVVKTTGDGAHAAFAIAVDGLAAALAAQRALAAEPWSEAGPLQVRMALHTGAAEARDGDYFGPTLNRVARLLAAGHGDQILLSAATWELVRDEVPPGAALRDLGAHRLKDLTRPEHIFQLVTPDLPADFPPLKTLDRRPHNLPAQPTALIGREKEIATVGALLRRADVRLVTLTGPGGTGKTRLGLQVAAELLDEFADGIWFVNLAPISDPNLVAAAVGQTLGIKESAGRALLDSLKDYLREKQLLLLLDNFEQVVDAAPLVGALLAAAPGLKVLVTSRIALHLSGEREIAVPPLSLPDRTHPPALERLTQYEAVRLFIERAQAVNADFTVTNANAPAVAEICVRVDGLPLAIELAAARIKLFPPQALLARLDNRLKLLTGGARDLPARQQTIRNTIDWSYQLLDAGEQKLFTRLGVFVGGWTLEAAEAVCNADGDLRMDVVDGIAALLDQSLVRQEEGLEGEPRITMLETIREYALERLAASRAAEAMRQRHTDHYLALAEEAEPQLYGPAQGAWLDRLEAEHDNLRAALAWALAAPHDYPVAELGVRLAGALTRFWGIRGYLSEGSAWLQGAVERSSNGSGAARAKVLTGAGELAWYQGDSTRAHVLLEAGLAISRTLGAKPTIIAALSGLGSVASFQGEPEQAAVLFEECLALSRDLGSTWHMASALNNLGWIALKQGKSQPAENLLKESLALSRGLRDKMGSAQALHGLGWAALGQSDYRLATTYFAESLVLSRELGYRRGVVGTIWALGKIARNLRNYTEAAALLEESLALAQELGNKVTYYSILFELGTIAQRQGDRARARALFAECLDVFRATGDMDGIAAFVEEMAWAAADDEQLVRAVQLFAAAVALRDAIGIKLLSPDIQVEFDRRLASTRTQLGEEAFAASWAAGQAMTTEQAIDYALEPTPEVVPSAPAPPAAPKPTVDASAYPGGMTAREVEVLRLVAEGLTNAQIAEKLILSPLTINAHLRSIFGKLGVTSRAAATRFAVDHQLV